MAENQNGMIGASGGQVKVNTAAIAAANETIIGKLSDIKDTFTNIEELMTKTLPLNWEGEAAAANKKLYIDKADRIAEAVRKLTKDTEILAQIGAEYTSTEKTNYEKAEKLGNLEGLSKNAIS